MKKNEIQVKFLYNGEPEKIIKCKSNETIGIVCKAFASKRGINFDSVHFLLNGGVLQGETINKTVNEFLNNLNPDILSIIVNDKPNIEQGLNQNRNVKVNFWFQNQPSIIQCNMESKMLDVSQNFANKIGRDINSLKFIYRNNILDFTKKFSEVADQFDKNKGSMEIIVEEINNIEIYQRRHSQNPIVQRTRSHHQSQGRLSQGNMPIFLLQTSPTMHQLQPVPVIQTIQNQPIVQQQDNSCCKISSKGICWIIIGVIIFIVIVVILILVFRKDSDDNDVPVSEDLNERCAVYSESSEEKQCNV